MLYRLRLATPLCGLLIVCTSALAQDWAPIVTPATEQNELSVESLMQAPAMASNPEAVMALAELQIDQNPALSEDVKKVLKGELKELPFHRILDLRLSFMSGIPDLIGACIEGHPVNELSIEACATTAILVTTLSAGVKYRWDLVLREDRFGHINQLALGPGFSVRKLQSCFDTCQNGFGADLFASLQYVFWITKHFGLNATFEAGATYWNLGPTAKDGRFLPIARISIGVSF